MEAPMEALMEAPMEPNETRESETSDVDAGGVARLSNPSEKSSSTLAISPSEQGSRKSKGSVRRKEKLTLVLDAQDSFSKKVNEYAAAILLFGEAPTHLTSPETPKFDHILEDRWSPVVASPRDQPRSSAGSPVRQKKRASGTRRDTGEALPFGEKSRVVAEAEAAGADSPGGANRRQEKHPGPQEIATEGAIRPGGAAGKPHAKEAVKEGETGSMVASAKVNAMPVSCDVAPALHPKGRDAPAAAAGAEAAEERKPTPRRIHTTGVVLLKTTPPHQHHQQQQDSAKERKQQHQQQQQQSAAAAKELLTQARKRFTEEAPPRQAAAAAAAATKEEKLHVAKGHAGGGARVAPHTEGARFLPPPLDATALTLPPLSPSEGAGGAKAHGTTPREGMPRSSTFPEAAAHRSPRPEGGAVKSSPRAETPKKSPRPGSTQGHHRRSHSYSKSPRVQVEQVWAEVGRALTDGKSPQTGLRSSSLLADLEGGAEHKKALEGKKHHHAAQTPPSSSGSSRGGAMHEGFHAFLYYEELVQRLASTDVHVLQQAATEVRLLARGSAEARKSLQKAGAIPPLVNALGHSEMQESGIETLVLALLNLAVGNERNKMMLMEEGVVPKLIALMQPQPIREGSPPTQGIRIGEDLLEQDSALPRCFPRLFKGGSGQLAFTRTPSGHERVTLVSLPDPDEDEPLPPGEGGGALCPPRPPLLSKSWSFGGGGGEKGGKTRRKGAKAAPSGLGPDRTTHCAAATLDPASGSGELSGSVLSPTTTASSEADSADLGSLDDAGPRRSSSWLGLGQSGKAGREAKVADTGSASRAALPGGGCGQGGESDMDAKVLMGMTAGRRAEMRDGAAPGGGSVRLQPGLPDVGFSRAGEAAAAVILTLSASSSLKLQLAQTGIVGPLLALLTVGSSQAQSDALRSLLNISTQAENHALLAQSGCVASLVSLVRTHATPHGEMALTVLVNIAEEREGQLAIHKAHEGVRTLVRALRDDSSDECKLLATRILLLVCSGSPIARKEAVREKAIEAATELTLLGSPEVEEGATRLLECLRKSSGALQEASGSSMFGLPKGRVSKKWSGPLEGVPETHEVSGDAPPASSDAPLYTLQLSSGSNSDCSESTLSRSSSWDGAGSPDGAAGSRLGLQPDPFAEPDLQDPAYAKAKSMAGGASKLLRKISSRKISHKAPGQDDEEEGENDVMNLTRRTSTGKLHWASCFSPAQAVRQR